MATVEFNGLFGGALSGVWLKVFAGCHVVISDAEAPGAQLIEFMAGLRRPRLGSLLVDGQDPSRKPELRRHIGTLLAKEPALPGDRLEELLGQLAKVRPFTSSPREVLGFAGLGHYREVLPKKLDDESKRKLAFSMALDTVSPKAFGFFEPLMFTDLSFRERVLRKLRELAERAPVICVTRSLNEALTLSGHLYQLTPSGVLLTHPLSALNESLPPRPHQGSQVAFLVECSDGERLAETLRNVAGVTHLTWPEKPNAIELRGHDRQLLAKVIAESALRASVQVYAIWPIPLREGAHMLTPSRDLDARRPERPSEGAQ